MWSIIAILFFTAILGFPSLYTIIRKLFPRNSKRSAFWFSGILTALLVTFLALVMSGVLFK